jgi:uncharacterized damage-inducible protein DinB
MDSLMDIAILEGKHPAYFKNYLSYLSDGPVLEIWENYLPATLAFWRSISEAESNYAYAEGKWTIKEMLLHIIDTDRIFAYRALAIARGEKQALPSYDQDLYVANSDANRRPYQEILKEYESVKIANLSLLQSFNERQWQASGMMADAETSVLALAYVMPGHDLHHIEICKSRYLKAAD